MYRFTHRSPAFLFGMLTLLLVWNCKSENKETNLVTGQEPAPEYLTYETRSMEFLGPDTIPSGWNAIAYENKSTEPHFLLFDKYPEGKTIADAEAEVLPPFDAGMAHIMEGEADSAMAAFGELPEWFGKVVQTGGTGMISQGRTAHSWMELEPGYYVMECYVKMPDGRFHASMGMFKEIYVSADSSVTKVPVADIELSISSTEGITLQDSVLSPGRKVFSVSFTDQTVHEHFMGHDVNLVYAAEGADMEALEAWMNWATPNGLMSSTVPAGITFLGGVNDAPAGSLQYFEAELEPGPGQYYLISEVPNAGDKGMIRALTLN